MQSALGGPRGRREGYVEVKPRSSSCCFLAFNCSLVVLCCTRDEELLTGNWISQPICTVQVSRYQIKRLLLMVKPCLGDRTLGGLFHTAVYSGIVCVTYTCGLLSC